MSYAFIEVYVTSSISTSQDLPAQSLSMHVFIKVGESVLFKENLTGT